MRGYSWSAFRHAAATDPSQAKAAAAWSRPRRASYDFGLANEGIGQGGLAAAFHRGIKPVRRLSRSRARRLGLPARCETGFLHLCSSSLLSRCSNAYKRVCDAANLYRTMPWCRCGTAFVATWCHRQPLCRQRSAARLVPRPFILFCTPHPQKFPPPKNNIHRRRPRCLQTDHDRRRSLLVAAAGAMQKCCCHCRRRRGRCRSRSSDRARSFRTAAKNILCRLHWSSLDYSGVPLQFEPEQTYFGTSTSSP